jgi:hypothetical protein
MHCTCSRRLICAFDLRYVVQVCTFIQWWLLRYIKLADNKPSNKYCLLALPLYVVILLQHVPPSPCYIIRTGCSLQPAATQRLFHNLWGSHRHCEAAMLCVHVAIYMIGVAFVNILYTMVFCTHWAILVPGGLNTNTGCLWELIGRGLDFNSAFVWLVFFSRY